MTKEVLQLLRDLRHAMLGNGAVSEDAQRALVAMHRAGLKVYLVADGGENESPEAIPLFPASDGKEAPLFRIDQEDLTILRDLGIDPTRTLRRRR